MIIFSSTFIINSSLFTSKKSSIWSLYGFEFNLDVVQNVSISSNIVLISASFIAWSVIYEILSFKVIKIDFEIKSKVYKGSFISLKNS